MFVCWNCDVFAGRWAFHRVQLRRLRINLNFPRPSANYVMHVSVFIFIWALVSFCRWVRTIYNFVVIVLGGFSIIIFVISNTNHKWHIYLRVHLVTNSGMHPSFKIGLVYYTTAFKFQLIVVYHIQYG